MFQCEMLKPLGRRLTRLQIQCMTIRNESRTTKSKKYSASLNLPKTQFQLSMKDAATRDKEIISLCGFENLYQWQRENNTGQEFILHDGPPYANGKPHVGHAINKILKDITNRYHLLRGNRVHYVPGWDCHGLPIELKALDGKTNLKLTPLQIRDKARTFAQEAVKVQMAGFQRWGVMADWHNQAYFTDNSQYEAKQIDTFYQLFEKGYIYQDVMPVYWSPSSRTALAESELEYKSDHVSTAIYVRLPLTTRPTCLQSHTEKKLYGIIWTTTPWTIPANQAVAYSERINYVVLEDISTGEQYICEDSFTSTLEQITSKQLQLIATIPGKELAGCHYQHPLTNEELPFLPAGHVTANKGTGLVHTAPAHGQDDFQLAMKHGIDVKVLLDDQCCFTEDAGEQLHGQAVGKDAEQIVLEALGSDVLHTEQFTHSYPYDWRTKKPVIVRTSKQWFIDTQAIKDKALKCLEEVKVQPCHLKSALCKMLDVRTYWCISRQRVWGVPLPVFYNKQTRVPLINRKTIDHIRQLISTHGSDCWWTLSHEELLPTSLLQQAGLPGTSEDYERGEDILDIWFDSGVSWATVLEAGKQADIYMEGTDQFGGWFQSSLLTSVALHNRAPYKNLVVHGFTMDEQGRKMSKSIGNVVDPDIVIHGGKNRQKEPAYGADVLRWWAALSNLQSHSSIGNVKLDMIRGELFELRKTLRFLLGNTSYSGDEQLVEYTQLLPQDQYMLYQLYQLAHKIPSLYENYEYVKLLRNIDLFCKDKVSKFYTPLIKDRCYCDDKSSIDRQSSITTQFHILDVLTRALAPILPFLTEDIYFNYPPARRKQDVDSLFKTGWYNLPDSWNNLDVLRVVEPVLDIRELLHTVIGDEPAMEFDVMVYTSTLLHQHLQVLQPELTSSYSALCELLQVASTTLTDEALTVIPDDVQAVSGSCNVHMSAGHKNPEKYVIIIKDTEGFLCERCRRFTSDKSNGLCARCLLVMTNGWE